MPHKAEQPQVKPLVYRRLAPALSACLLAVAGLAGHALPSRAQEGAAAQPTPARPRTKRVTPLRKSDSAQGSRVTITSDGGALNDYKAYRSGDRFIVVIPQAEAVGGGGGVAGRGLQGAQVTKSGNDLVYTFKLEPGATARVNQRFNQLDVQVTAPKSGDSASTQPAANASAAPTPRPQRTPAEVSGLPAATPAAVPTPDQARAAQQTHPRAAEGSTPGAVPTPDAAALAFPSVTPSPEMTPAASPTAEQIAQVLPTPAAPVAAAPQTGATQGRTLGAAVVNNWPWILAALLAVGVALLFVGRLGSRKGDDAAPPDALKDKSAAKPLTGATAAGAASSAAGTTTSRTTTTATPQSKATGAKPTPAASSASSASPAKGAAVAPVVPVVPPTEAKREEAAEAAKPKKQTKAERRKEKKQKEASDRIAAINAKKAAADEISLASDVAEAKADAKQTLPGPTGTLPGAARTQAGEADAPATEAGATVGAADAGAADAGATGAKTAAGLVAGGVAAAGVAGLAARDDAAGEEKGIVLAAADAERAGAEVQNLLAGAPYDESLVGASDSATRQLVAAELSAALAGRNSERNARARAAFLKHGYFDDAARDLQSAEAPAQRAAAALSLSLLHDRAATPHLIAALEDPSPEVRRASVEALSQLKDPAACAPLDALRWRERSRLVPQSLIRHAIETCTPTVSEADDTLVTDEETIIREAAGETPAVAEAAAEAADETTVEIAPAVTETVEAETVEIETVEAAAAESPATETTLIEATPVEDAPVEVVTVEAAPIQTWAAETSVEESPVETSATETAVDETARVSVGEAAHGEVAADEAVVAETPETGTRPASVFGFEPQPIGAVASDAKAVESAEVLEVPAAETASEAGRNVWELEDAHARPEAAPARPEETPAWPGETSAREFEPVSLAGEETPVADVAPETAADTVYTFDGSEAAAWASRRERPEDESRAIELAPAEPRQSRPADARAEMPVYVAPEFAVSPEAAASTSADEWVEVQFGESEAATGTAEAASPEVAREVSARAAEEKGFEVSSEEKGIELAPEVRGVEFAPEAERAAGQKGIELAPAASASGAVAADAVTELSPFESGGAEEVSGVAPVAEVVSGARELDAPGREAAEAGDRGLAAHGFEADELSIIPKAIQLRLDSPEATERAESVLALARLNTGEAYRQICEAFDDRDDRVRNAAARALYEVADDRADSFTRALRESQPERRRRIGAALASSGLAEEAIGQLTGESRDRTYDAFSLLFLMAKASETAPLIHAIESHPDTEVRLAVVKLLALSGQQEVLPAFRRLAVRGSLPTEVRAAVMEAIYQISSGPAATNRAN